MLPNAHVSDRRWKKAIRLLQASAPSLADATRLPGVLSPLQKICLWYDAQEMRDLMQQQLEVLMTGHAAAQQAMLTRLGGIVSVLTPGAAAAKAVKPPSPSLRRRYVRPPPALHFTRKPVHQR